MRLAGFVVLFSCGMAAAQGAAPCSFGMNNFTGFGWQNKTGFPYTVTVRTTHEQKLADGNVVKGFVVTHDARNSVGTTRYESAQQCLRGEDGQPMLAYSVSVYSMQDRTSLYWSVNSLSTNPDKVARLTVSRAPKQQTPEERAAMAERSKRQQAMYPPRGKYKSEDLGTKDLHGVTVQGTRTTETIAAGQQGNTQPIEVVQENWRSMATGLEMLQIWDDPRRGKTTMEVEEISQSEPDPALFEPPPGYTIKEQVPQ